MNTAIQTVTDIDTFTTAEERAADLLLNVFGGDVVMRGKVVCPELSQDLAAALRTIAAEATGTKASVAA